MQFDEERNILRIGLPEHAGETELKELTLQACGSFDIPACKLIWVEHYDAIDLHGEWRMVQFGVTLSNYPAQRGGLCWSCKAFRREGLKSACT